MTEPLSFNFEQASARLGAAFPVDWLKSRVKQRLIPHGKNGAGTGNSGRVYFTEEHLRQILLMFSVEPETGSQPGDFTPVTRRRSA